jgi:regulator of nucleoside diphosphate kinase
MAAVAARERTLTHLDHVRLTRLLAAAPQAQHEAELDHLLSSSDLVAGPSVPPEVVTMYSQFVIAEMASCAHRKITLCYPPDADPAAGLVSVLAPMGAALIGLRVGDVARWTVPGGQTREARVTQMLFQPEASGDYTR